MTAAAPPSLPERLTGAEVNARPHAARGEFVGQAAAPHVKLGDRYFPVSIHTGRNVVQLASHSRHRPSRPQAETVK